MPPDILDYPTSTDMVVREGSNVTLKCAATGTPTPNITWRREGGELIALGNGQEGMCVFLVYFTIPLQSLSQYHIDLRSLRISLMTSYNVYVYIIYLYTYIGTCTQIALHASPHTLVLRAHDLLILNLTYLRNLCITPCGYTFRRCWLLNTIWYGFHCINEIPIVKLVEESTEIIPANNICMICTDSRWNVVQLWNFTLIELYSVSRKLRQWSV